MAKGITVSRNAPFTDKADLLDEVTARISKLLLSALCAGTILGGSANAAEETTLKEVKAIAERVELKQHTEVGSHLGLTAKETPATVNIISQEKMQKQGLTDLIDVYNAIPGVVSGNNPGEPGMVSMRGFGRASTGYLIDGVRTIDPVLMMRNYDSYHFARVEALKGPASIVNGTGALAGAINLVTRKPDTSEATQDAFVNYGSFNTFRAGAAFNQPVNDKTAANATITYGRSDGYIDDTDFEKFGLTTGIMTEAMDRLKLSVALDYFRDNFDTAYYATPLIPLSSAMNPSDEVSTTNGFVLDEAIKHKNYNVTDGLMESDSVWLRANAEYALTDSWKVDNRFSFFTADRSWMDVDFYTFNTGTGLLDRDATLITHDHQFWSNRLTLSNDGEIAGRRNRFTVGAEYIATEFKSKRRFGTSTAVDPFNPVRGLFPAENNTNFYYRQNFDSQVDTAAVFAEDAFNVTPNWLVVVGVRYENIELERGAFNLISGTTTMFDRYFEGVSWRVGTVYDVNEDISLFAQFNRATIPTATLLLSNTNNTAFELSTGESFEGGIKSSFLNDRGMATLSLYQIDQDDILTRDPNNPAFTVQGGSQRSRGIEFDVALEIMERWKVGANASVVDTEFTELSDGQGNSLEGNRPVNVPNHTFNLNTAYTLEQLPLTMGAGVRHAGAFFTNNANTIEVAGRTLLDISLSYPVGRGTLVFRGKNLTDEFYADWSGYSSTQVYVGEPRVFEMTYGIRF